jgi:endonuclease NucS-like protein
MNEEQTQTLSLKAAYAFGAAHALEHEVNDIRELVIEWDSSHTSSLRRGYIVALFEEHGIFDAFKKEHWSFGNTPPGETKRLKYLRIKAEYEAFLAGRGPEPAGESGTEASSDTEQASEFALEAHLRDFLAKNLDRIEPGLRLYDSQERNGVEFAVDGGRIDLLAVDRNEKFVVIELKLSQGRNKALGQLLYYMGWVDKHLGEGPCRGFIIASDITEELSIAVSRVTGVRLAEYHMSFAIEPIGPT